MFKHLSFVTDCLHDAHGVAWEIKIYQAVENGNLSVFVSNLNGIDRDELFITQTGQSDLSPEGLESLIEWTRADIDENAAGKYLVVDPAPAGRNNTSSMVRK